MPGGIYDRHKAVGLPHLGLELPRLWAKIYFFLFINESLQAFCHGDRKLTIISEEPPESSCAAALCPVRTHEESGKLRAGERAERNKCLV